MQSKTSFFNKAVFKKNLSRTWIVGLLYFILLTLMVPVVYLLQLSDIITSNFMTGYQAQYIMASLLSSFGAGFIPMLIAIITTGLTYKYLFTKKDSYMMHAFPVSRKALFFTGVLSTAIVLLVPLTLTVIITLIAAAATGIGHFAVNILFWYFVQASALIFYIGLSLFSLMLSGQIITAIVFYFIFNFLYLMMEVTMRLFASEMMTGLGDAMNYISYNLLTPVMYISANCGLDYSVQWNAGYDKVISIIVTRNGGIDMLIYLVAAIVLIAVAFVIYKFKKLETVADFITVPAVKPIFSMGVSFFVSVVLSVLTVDLVMYVKNLTYSSKYAIYIVSFIIFGIIIYYVTSMMIAKTFRVFNGKTALNCGIYSIIAFAVILSLRFDAFGIENRVPDADDIAWVGINGDYTMVFTDTEDIDNILDFHKSIVNDKKEIRDLQVTAIDNADSDIIQADTVIIKYKLNNGKYLCRKYYMVDPDEDYVSDDYVQLADAYLDFVNDPSIIKQHIIGDKWDDCTASLVSFAKYVEDEEYGGYTAEYTTFEYMSNAELTEMYNDVYQAFLKDIDAGAVLQTKFGSSDDDYYNDFDITLVANSGIFSDDQDKYWDYSYTLYDDSTEYYASKYLYATLNHRCTNTLEKLKEYGFYDSDDQLYDDSSVGYDDSY